MRKKIIFLFGILAVNITGYAQNNDSIRIKKIADEIMTNGKAYDNLRYLCKAIGPRLSGSSNAQKAVLATAQMLKDAGADTVYLQPCMVPHWVRGEKETGYIRLADGSKYDLHLCALGNSAGSGKNGVESAVIEVRSFAELARLGESQVKGKIIFFNFAMNPTYINSFTAYGESGIARRAGASEAARYGAIAIMVRSLASNVDDHPHTGAMAYNDSFPKIPAVAISTKDAEWLSAELKKKTAVTAYFKTSCTMLEDVPSFNVIGEIRGTVFPEQIISVGGHLDSWDLAEGAQDDGTGCVQGIEVIRALKATGMPCKRTVRAVMFMNEENGGRGGKEYLNQARKKKEQHIFALESDGGGFTPRGFNLDMSEARRNKVMQWKPLFYNYGVYEFVNGHAGSDIGPLTEIGTALAGYTPDSQRYFDLHHAETDVFEAVSRRELHLGTVNMAAFVWLVSEYGL